MIYCLNFVKKNMEVFLNRHPHVREIPLVCMLDIELLQDHPRMCGKYLAVFCASYAWLGSPPHVREIHRKSTR